MKSQVSRSTEFRREKRARELGCSVDELPDNRGKHTNQRKGSSHWRWNQGRIITPQGYVKVRVGKTHPLADPNGYTYEHILVWVSAGNNRPQEGFIIHHKNEDKTDNRLSNLELISRGEHNRIHNNDKLRDPKTGRFIKKDHR